MSYKQQEIWQEAHQLAISLHQMTLNNLPHFEMHEVGSQIRRSNKSILFLTGALKDEDLYMDLHRRLNILGRKLNRFIAAVRNSHRPV